MIFIYVNEYRFGKKFNIPKKYYKLCIWKSGRAVNFFTHMPSFSLPAPYNVIFAYAYV